MRTAATSAIAKAVLEGIADVKAGRVVPHEKVIADVESVIARAKSRSLRPRHPEK